jgi:hypothetical protein
MQRSDDDLLDYWFIYGPEGPIEVTEEVMKAARDARDANTIINHDDLTGIISDAFICPVLFDFKDLYGSEVSMSVDSMYMFGHATPESRALNRRQSALIEKEADDKPEWEQ